MDSTLYSEEAWANRCKQQWLDCAVTYYLHQRTAVSGRSPDETPGAFRSRFLDTVGEYAICLATGLKQLSLANQAILENAIKEWQVGYLQCEDVPLEFLPLREIRLVDMEALFMSELVPRNQEYALCRRRACGFVCDYNDVIHTTSPGDPYIPLCPACGHQYHPWMTQSDFVNANCVFAFPARRCTATSQLQGTALVPPGTGTLHYDFPCDWP